MIVGISNPTTDHLEKSYFSQYAQAGATTIYVTNTEKFASTQKLLLGKMGTERAEIVTAGTVTPPSTVAVSATKFGHNADDPVYVLAYDKIKIYRAATVNGSYSLLDTVDVDVDNESKRTAYNDATATGGEYYKFTYYNSVTTDETDYSDPVKTTGYENETIGEVINETASLLRDPSFSTLSMEDYITFANQVGHDLLTQSHRPYDFLKKEFLFDTTQAVPFLDVAANIPDFWKFDSFFWTETTAGVDHERQIKNPLSKNAFVRRYGSVSFPDNDRLKDVAYDEVNKLILLGPAPKTSRVGKMKLVYYAKFTKFTGPSDVVQTPSTYIYYLKFRMEFYRAKGESDKAYLAMAQDYYNQYQAEIVKMQRANRADAGTPRQMLPPNVPGYNVTRRLRR